MRRTVPQSVFDSQDALRAARLGHDAACRELDRLPRSALGLGNPNHPSHDGIFGYERDEFMARQYAVAA